MRAAWWLLEPALRQRYDALLAAPPAAGDMYSGVAHHLFAPGTELGPMLPVSHAHLCAAETNTTAERWMVRLQNSMQFHMNNAYAQRQGHLFCGSYARLLERALAGRSDAELGALAWLFEFPHYVLPFRTGLYAKVALGVFLAQENRLGGAARGRTIPIPFYSPALFAEGAAPRTTLFAESSGHRVHCHRYDHFPSQHRSWSCADPVMRRAGYYRALLRQQVARLRGGVSQALPQQSSPAAMGAKARLYASSRFCVAPPGDSYVTPRVPTSNKSKSDTTGCHIREKRSSCRVRAGVCSSCRVRQGALELPY